jgi:hypothetical protein
MNRSLNKFIENFPNSYIYTPLWESGHWLYNETNQKKISPWLTGFVNVNATSIYSKFSKPWSSREIDLGQRVTELPLHFGIEGNLKSEIAIGFAIIAEQQGFKCDVSTDESRMFIGEDWFKFLGNTKFVISRLSGASLITQNPIDVIRAKALTKVYRKSPKIELVKRISGRQTERPYLAISPRIFESAALGNCQILERGEYMAELQAWEEYVPIQRDLGNASEVIDFMKHGDAEKVARNAKAKIIDSGKFNQETWIKKFYADLGLKEFSKGAQININEIELLWKRKELLKSQNQRSRYKYNPTRKWISI